MPQTDVSDVDGRMRMLAERCSTCIFRPGNLMHLHPGRLAALVAAAHRADGFIVCHSTLVGVAPEGFRPAVCRGFADRYSTNALRIMGRIGGIVEVDPPTTEDR